MSGLGYRGEISSLTPRKATLSVQFFGIKQAFGAGLEVFAALRADGEDISKVVLTKGVPVLETIALDWKNASASTGGRRRH
jgi:hypothetical protein